MSKNNVLLILVVQAAALIFVSSALAGSWYIRGNISLEWSRSADFSDEDSLSVNPPALFGNATGSDGLPVGAYGDFEKIAGFEAAAGGYVFPWLRADLSFSLRPGMDYDGHANFTGVPGDQPVRTEAESFVIMSNLFLEVAPLLNISSGRFRPYVGGGIGIAFNRLDRMTYEFPGLTVHKVSITPEGKNSEPAFMLTLGTGIALSGSVILDIAYRYEHIGRLRTDQGNMYMNHMPAGILIGETQTRLRSHGLTLGIRYSF